jgi:hypothetical protein
MLADQGKVMKEVWHLQMFRSQHGFRWLHKIGGNRDFIDIIPFHPSYGATARVGPRPPHILEVS